MWETQAATDLHAIRTYSHPSSLFFCAPSPHYIPVFIASMLDTQKSIIHELNDWNVTGMSLDLLIECTSLSCMSRTVDQVPYLVFPHLVHC